MSPEGVTIFIPTTYDEICPNSPGIDASFVAQQAPLPIVRQPISVLTCTWRPCRSSSFAMSM